MVEEKWDLWKSLVTTRSSDFFLETAVDGCCWQTGAVPPNWMHSSHHLVAKFHKGSGLTLPMARQTDGERPHQQSTPFARKNKLATNCLLWTIIVCFLVNLFFLASDSLPLFQSSLSPWAAQVQKLRFLNSTFPWTLPPFSRTTTW